VKCEDCTLMHTSPRPSRAAMPRYYPDEYQPHGEHFAPSVNQDGFIRRLLRRLLDPKEVVIPMPNRPRRVLEVGCGSGRTLVALAEKGWDVHGLEPSAAAVATLRAHRSLPVTVGTIEDVNLPGESFDLIVATMVVEHLHDPVGDLTKLRSWLRPGGYLSGSVPNCESWEFRVFGADWFALQVPTHLMHFTPRTLTLLLENSGFRRVQIHQQRNVNNLMMHLGRFLAQHRLPWATTCLDYPERGSRALRLIVRPVATALAWLKQAGRISFTAQNSRV